MQRTFAVFNRRVSGHNDTEESADIWTTCDMSSKQLSSFNSYCVYSVYRMAWDLYKSVQFKIKTQKMALWLIFAADYNTDKFVI